MKQNNKNFNSKIKELAKYKKIKFYSSYCIYKCVLYLDIRESTKSKYEKEKYKIKDGKTMLKST